MYYVDKMMRLKVCASQSFTLQDNANGRIERWLSNCRVQLIFCKTIQNNIFKKLIGVTTCYIVGMLYW